MSYLTIKDHYEKCLESSNIPHRQVDWESPEKAKARYGVIKQAIASYSKSFPITLLDFGCGVGGLADDIGNTFTTNDQLLNMEYTGLDISQKFIDIASKLIPRGEFICQDILSKPLHRSFDIIACNGTFTEKRDLSHAQMRKFVIRCLSHLWDITNHALIFNFMDPSRICKEDRFSFLFFETYDNLIKYYLNPLGVSKWTIRADYGTNDYMVHCYK